MQKVRCYECGKTYDYGEDAFCPHCGAFNQAPRSARTGAAIRVDGLEEQGHKGSFLHREYHREEQERKWTGLEKKTIKTAVPKTAKSKAKGNKGTSLDGFAILKWIVAAFVLLQFFAGWL